MARDDMFDDLGDLLDPLDIFDFDRDGMHSATETLMAEDFLCDDESESSDDESDWESSFKDDSEFGIDPDDYDDEDEYMEALEEARAQKGEDNNFLSKSADFSDRKERTTNYDEYMTQRKKDAVEDLGYRNGKEEKDQYDLEAIERCNFILNNSDVVASNYLTYHGEFLYVQAIQDHFKLPFDFPIEDTEVQTPFSQYLSEMVISNLALALDTWAWCLREFKPYVQYEEDKKIDDLTKFALAQINDDLDDDCHLEFIDYLEKHGEFLNDLVDLLDDPYEFEDTLYLALQNKRIAVVLAYGRCLVSQRIAVADRISAVSRVLGHLTDYHSGPFSYRREAVTEREEIDDQDKWFYVFIEIVYKPVVKKITEPRIVNQFKKWDKIVSEYYYDLGKYDFS